MSFIGTPDNGEQIDNNEGVLEYIAQKYEEGLVTDNNPSQINQLTGLEQAIAFHYNLNPFDKYDDIETLKLEVIKRVNQEIALKGYATESGLNLDLSPLKTGLYNRDDQDIHKQFIYNYYPQKDYTNWIEKMARAFIGGFLTEDNPSYRGLTGLDQVIILGCNLEPLTQDRDSVIGRIIKSTVKSRVSDYNGGNNINNGEEKLRDLEMS
jgi:hypothetical protein